MVYDALQLNRVELMLYTILQVVSINQNSGDVDEHDGIAEPIPSVTGQQLPSSSKDSSRNRRQRATRTRKRLWERSHPTKPDEVVASQSSQAPQESLLADSSAMMSAMFQKLVDMETNADCIKAIVEDSNVKACQSVADAEKLAFPIVAETVPHAIATSSDLNLRKCASQSDMGEALQRMVSTAAPGNTLLEDVAEDETASVAEPGTKVNEDDQSFLMSLRGARKEDVVLALLLNRSCKLDDIQGVLDDMEKYFQSELPKLASFLGMKFGFKVGDWMDCRSQIMSALRTVEGGPAKSISLGTVLKDMRKSRANTKADLLERTKHLTDELSRPRKNKRRK